MSISLKTRRYRRAVLKNISHITYHFILTFAPNLASTMSAGKHLHGHTLPFIFVQNVKVYSFVSELCVSWSPLSNRHWHKILLLWAQIYIFIFRLVVVFVLCCKVFNTRVCENKVGRGVRGSTLKDEIIALSTFSVNCPQLFYIKFYKLLQTKISTFLSLELVPCN